MGVDRSKPIRKLKANRRHSIFILLLISPIQNVLGFAAWLKCYVDITDTEEIVMNYLILPKEEAKHGEVQIEVKGVDDDHWVTDGYTFDPTQTTNVMARLKVPSTIAEMDVQYVMEIVSNNNGTNNDKVQFTRPANVCKGKRAHATHYTDSVVLQIPAVIEDSSTAPASVQLIAVYATGHEAVTQTEIITLQPNIVEEEL